MEDITSIEKVAIIANGHIDDYEQMREIIKGYDQLIAVDGGLRHCVQLGIAPVLLIGDMDSINPKDKESFPKLKEVTLEKDKDETDLEVAVRFLMKKKPKCITVFGGLGNRTDHTVTNLIFLTRYPGKVFLETEMEIVGAIDKTLQLRTRPGQILSLIPLNGPVGGITTEGLKWEMKEGRLDKSFVGISNEATGKDVLIKVKQGDLLYCMTKFSPFF